MHAVASGDHHTVADHRRRADKIADTITEEQLADGAVWYVVFAEVGTSRELLNCALESSRRSRRNEVVFSVDRRLGRVVEFVQGLRNARLRCMPRRRPRGGGTLRVHE